MATATQPAITQPGPTQDEPSSWEQRRVEHLTGLSVGKITIEISWLNPSSHVRKSLK